ncbi:MAG: GNAT family N-acetyltransferase [Aliishimia sp.]
MVIPAGAITLDRISPHHLRRVEHIEVHPSQIPYSGTVQEAFEAEEPRVDFHCIQKMSQMVGFFKLDRDYYKVHRFATGLELGVRGFMVDQRVQGQGIGRAAIEALPAYVRRVYPGIIGLALTVNQSNVSAYHCYLGGGFKDTGQIWPHGDAGPQNIMKMTF